MIITTIWIIMPMPVEFEVPRSTPLSCSHIMQYCPGSFRTNARVLRVAGRFSPVDLIKCSPQRDKEDCVWGRSNGSFPRRQLERVEGMEFAKTSIQKIHDRLRKRIAWWLSLLYLCLRGRRYICPPRCLQDFRHAHDINNEYTISLMFCGTLEREARSWRTG